MKSLNNPWNTLYHKKYEIEEIPSWAIIRAMRLKETKTSKVMAYVWSIGLLLAVQVIAILEWAR